MGRFAGDSRDPNLERYMLRRGTEESTTVFHIVLKVLGNSRGTRFMKPPNAQRDSDTSVSVPFPRVGRRSTYTNRGQFVLAFAVWAIVNPPPRISLLCRVRLEYLIHLTEANLAVYVLRHATDVE